MQFKPIPPLEQKPMKVGPRPSKTKNQTSEALKSSINANCEKVLGKVRVKIIREVLGHDLAACPKRLEAARRKVDALEDWLSGLNTDWPRYEYEGYSSNDESSTDSDASDRV